MTPLGDPIQVTVRGYELSIRRAEGGDRSRVTRPGGEHPCPVRKTPDRRILFNKREDSQTMAAI